MTGVVSSDPEHSVDRDMLHRMARTMVHRGPDGEGYFIGPGVGLGVRRLSIIDPETGDQPIANEDGSITVVCNGEIYNYRELRRGLEAAGHRFRSHSDVEVIVHLYEDHGERCVDLLRGMFAFALWDARHRRLMLARDRLGIKPLSYAVTPGGLYFGSEYKAILASGCIDRAVDAGAVRQLFALGFVLTPNTLLRAVRRLPLAHYLLYERGQLRLQRYWDLAFPSRVHEGPRRSEGQWAEALRAKLQESVCLHLRSDVPIGAYVSSGIDSSAIAGLMRGRAAGPVSTFSVAFEDPRFDEIRRNKILPDFASYELRSHITTCTTADLDLLPKAIWHREDPTLSAAMIPHMLLARAAADHVKVVLTGEGSDEIFGGYPWYRAERFLQPFMLLPLGLRRLLATVPLPRNRWPRLRRGFVAPARMDLARYARLMDNPSFMPQDEIFSDQLRRIPVRLGETEPHLRLPGEFERWDRFAQLQFLEISSRLSDYITRTVDAGSMAYGVEARVPFLDHELVELCSLIPANMKMRGLREKHILRRALDGVLPAEILARRKRGLAAPSWPWRDRLPPFVTEAMSESALREKGYFHPGNVRLMLEQHQEGKVSFGKELIGVLSVQIWDDVFVRGRHPA